MPLVDLWTTSPATVSQFTIEQVVATAGDGNLRDESLCSAELREYLQGVQSECLYDYVDGCLTRGFTKSGSVLQDLINELGRRLDYQVENGLYQGRSNAIGFDGIWRAPDGRALVLEVKTTDAYRINLDTIAGYRDALLQTNKVSRRSSILVVVGRTDTGDVEAQVRGSKHAWDIRLISADALVKLVKLKESADEEETANKIRDLLKPFDYTRLDNIIDVMFTAAKDVEQATGLERGFEPAGADREPPRGQNQEHTHPDVLSALRKRIVHAFGQRLRVEMIGKSRALYRDAGNALRVCCAISKRYPLGTYWYAYHLHWDQFLEESDRSFLILRFVDKEIAYALPNDFIKGVLNHLYTTGADVGERPAVPGSSGARFYWHLHLENSADGEMYLLLGKGGKKQPLSEHGFKI